jgi:three-Cys-motif partner protein
MPNKFHDKNFDEGTLTKLQIFELYVQEWLPVFLSKEKPKWSEIHIFDFFAGPGTDTAGEFGSPLRILRQINSFRSLAGFAKTHIGVHFFDESVRKVAKLKSNIESNSLKVSGLHFDIQPLPFSSAFERVKSTLASGSAAKLVFADQFGIDQITDNVFQELVGFPTCDFLFFISSSTLHRFREHPAIRQKIKRPDDYYHVHRAVLDYYRGLLPKDGQYYLAPFSIKKGPNIYGIIFGSGHPLGLDKFLRVAWDADKLNGEADFDIHRDDILPGEMFLPIDDFRPSKVTAFERDLEKAVRDGKCPTEREVIWKCFDHGVTRKHAEPVLAKLKKEGVIKFDFRVPDVKCLHQPRPIYLI